MKRTFTKTLTQTKVIDYSPHYTLMTIQCILFLCLQEDLLQLEVGPKHKSMKVPSTPGKYKQHLQCTSASNYYSNTVVVTIYVRKEEEKVYNALLLDDATVDGLKYQVSLMYYT